MATLTGNAINTSYQGLIKTDDNGALSALSLKQLSDGLGNTAPLALSQTSICIGSLASASVIEAYSSGMTLANQTNTDGILFNAGGVDFTGNMDFTAATVTGLPSAGLESGAGADSMQSSASLTTIGANASGACSIALGENSETCSLGINAIAIGNGSTAGEQSSISLGVLAISNCICSIAIGRNNIANANGAVALGRDITAAKADTVSVKEFETQTAGGGIYLTTPDGLAQPKLTVDNSSNLLIGGNPVGGAAGLESGTGTDSMQSAASLTTTAANASGACSIAMGEAACSLSDNGIAIGQLADAGSGIYGSVAIGPRAKATGISSIAIASNSVNAAVTVSGWCAIGIGQRMTVSGRNAVALGFRADTAGECAVTIGPLAGANQNHSVAIGNGANANAVGAIALGCGVVAAKADTVTVKELETCVAGGGIYLTTPDGLAQPKLTVDNSCALLIDGSPVGGGGAAGLVAGTGTDSMQSAASLTAIAADASGDNTIALGCNAIATAVNSVVIGRNACSSMGSAVVIGCNARSCQSEGVTIGINARGDGQRSIAIGRSACTLGSALGIAIGNYARTCQLNAIAIGAAGLSVDGGAKSQYSIAIGSGGRIAIADGEGAIAIGGNDNTSCTRAQGTCAITIGYKTCSLANGAVALGYDVTANKVDTVTVRSLETCVAGEGVIMTTPDGLNQYKITVDNSGNLVSTLVV